MNLPLAVVSGSIKSERARGKHALWAMAHVPLQFSGNSAKGGATGNRNFQFPFACLLH
jgi:hypothetical protein